MKPTVASCGGDYKCYMREHRRWRRLNEPARIAFDLYRHKKGLDPNQAPRWLTTEQWRQMDAIYWEARKQGKTVDHIHPLYGMRGTEHVSCGLHVPWNLQILSSVDNASKNNGIKAY